MIEIKLIQDLEQAKEIWNQLSKNETLYDRWDVRYCFYKHKPYPLYFYVAYDEETPVALLPLEYNTKENYLEFLAEAFIEGNHPFFKSGYEYLLPKLFQIDFPYPVQIFDLDGEDQLTSALPLEDYVYYVNISQFKNFDDYLLQAFPNGRKRYNFKRLFTLLEKEHSLEIIEDDFSGLEKLMDLNVKNFGTESYLNTKVERQAFFDLLQLPLDWKMMALVVDGQKLAYSLSVIYNKVYYYLIVGSDISEVKDAFKYLTKANMELALKNGAQIFDCSLGDCNWKQYWHLTKKPQYKFEKGL
ncbi:MAG TPA: GNAT family N-acetyltransferase [Candidatus Saccharimonadales bacterium]|nr:GNAT family N-acetyltransferase [Candidatus Saccharimonadales bacterium]